MLAGRKLGALALWQFHAGLAWAVLAMAAGAGAIVACWYAKSHGHQEAPTVNTVEEGVTT